MDQHSIGGVSSGMFIISLILFALGAHKATSTQPKFQCEYCTYDQANLSRALSSLQSSAEVNGNCRYDCSYCPKKDEVYGEYAKTTERRCRQHSKDKKSKRVTNTTLNSKVRSKGFELNITDNVARKPKRDAPKTRSIFQVGNSNRSLVCPINDSRAIFNSRNTDQYLCSSNYNEDHRLRNRVGTINTRGNNCLDDHAFSDSFRSQICLSNDLYHEYLDKFYQLFSVDTCVSYDTAISDDLYPSLKRKVVNWSCPFGLDSIWNYFFKPSKLGNESEEPYYSNGNYEHDTMVFRRKETEIEDNKLFLARDFETVGLVVSASSILTLIICGVYTRVKKSNKKPENDISLEAEEDIGCSLCLGFEFSTIKFSTNNFSQKNKIGQSTIGATYRGELHNGQQIVVKRLYWNNSQSFREYLKNEIVGSKFLHRNLVRLLGFCSEKGESFFVYEFVPMSLDRILFDTQKTEHINLNWDRRFMIIKGIASGLIYLHQVSGLTIIHGDIRASKVLLDENLNPKILGYGSAKLFGVDHQSDRVIKEYIDPEYFRRALKTAMSDVYSFGVLILEIISGKRSGCFRKEHSESLISYASRNWLEGTASNLADPKIRNNNSAYNSESEIIRCIHIALLCVQAEADFRPTMSSVFLMLNCDSHSLPLLVLSESENYDTDVELHDDQCSNDNFVSASEVSLSEISETSFHQDSESDNGKSGLVQFRVRFLAGFRDIRSLLDRNFFWNLNSREKRQHVNLEESNVLV